MAIASPVTPPAALKLAQIEIHRNSVVGESRSPFTGEEQVYVHQGEWWEFDATVRLMKRADADDVNAFLSSLNGKEHYFLFGDPTHASARGSWGGTIQVNGAHAAGVKTVSLKGLTATTGTIKACDMLQFGSGSATRLHEIVVNGTADGSGVVSAEIWPRTRAALADNATVTIVSPKGLWRLASNRRSHVVRRGLIYEVRFAAVEALNP